MSVKLLTCLTQSEKLQSQLRILLIGLVQVFVLYCSLFRSVLDAANQPPGEFFVMPGCKTTFKHFSLW